MAIDEDELFGFPPMEEGDEGSPLHDAAEFLDSGPVFDLSDLTSRFGDSLKEGAGEIDVKERSRRINALFEAMKILLGIVDPSQKSIEMAKRAVELFQQENPGVVVTSDEDKEEFRNHMQITYLSKDKNWLLIWVVRGARLHVEIQDMQEEM